LDHFPKFFSAAIGKPIAVDNPFIWNTKGDVVRSIVDHGCGALIKHTVSLFAVSRPALCHSCRQCRRP
jgi:7-cyano-7-deazaguanine synthase in queuosine biosynthesis